MGKRFGSWIVVFVMLLLPLRSVVWAAEIKGPTVNHAPVSVKLNIPQSTATVLSDEEMNDVTGGHLELGWVCWVVGGYGAQFQVFGMVVFGIACAAWDGVEWVDTYIYADLFSGVVSYVQNGGILGELARVDGGSAYGTYDSYSMIRLSLSYDYYGPEPDYCFNLGCDCLDDSGEYCDFGYRCDGYSIYDMGTCVEAPPPIQ